MRRLLNYFTLLVPVLFLTSCIITESPDSGVKYTIGTDAEITFLVQSLGSEQWYLGINDEDLFELEGEIGKSYTFNSADYGPGEYTIIVVNTLLNMPSETREWMVIVKATECTPDATRACDTGLPGVCAAGTETCVDGFWGVCEQDVASSPEDCSDGLDNDCDGAVDAADEECRECISGETISCDTGVPGVCADGTKTCIDGFWSACEQDVASSPEDCGDGLDNDCDGAVDAADNDCWECTPGETHSCGTGGLGVCTAGTETCVDGFWSACEQNVTSSPEDCSDGLDNDCDGVADAADEECWECAPGEIQSCDTGGLGVCAAGTETCIDGFWSTCEQDAASSSEDCSDGLDNDCDGDIDADDADCVIAAPQPPENIDASDLTSTYVAIDWNVPGSGADYYQIFRSYLPTGLYDLVSPNDDTLTEVSWDYIESWDDVQSALGPIPEQLCGGTDIPSVPYSRECLEDEDPIEADKTVYQAELDAYGEVSRKIITDFKDIQYFRAKAVNSGGESDFSNYDAGQALLEHSDPSLGGTSDYLDIFIRFWGYPVLQALASGVFDNVKDEAAGWRTGNGVSYTYPSPTGNGGSMTLDIQCTSWFVFPLTISVTISYSHYEDGRVSDPDGRADRTMIINGSVERELTLGELLDFLGDDPPPVEASGTFSSTGDYEGTISATLELNISDINATTGAADVTYDGVTYTGYTLELPQ